MNTSITNKLFILLFMLVPAFMLAQQTGNIKGIIQLSDNKPAENISIAVIGTFYSTNSDAKGQYEIKNVKPGSYTVRISAVGITTIENNVTVVAGETVTKNFTLSESQEQLNEVVIDGKTNKFNRNKSVTVSKMPLRDLENPQVYNTITNELLKEQVVTSFDDALKNVPGLDKLWESTGRGNDGAGYYSLRGFPVQPTMVNALPSLSNGSPDPANIERIEVIKGPSGTLFGSSLISYGGLINVTTKKPYDTFGGNISFTGGSYGLNRYTVDINTPLSTERKVALRVNAAYHNQESFQDAGFKKSFFVAPSLSYEVNDRLSFFVNTEFYNGKSTNPTMLFLDRGSELRTNNMDELGYDNYRSYTSNDLYIETPTFNIQGQMNYKLSEEWTSQTVVSSTSTKSNGFYSYLYEATATGEAVLGESLEGVVFARYMSNQNSKTYATDLQQNFIGDFKVAGIRNRMVVGFDYFNRNVVNNSSAYVGNGYVYIGSNLDKFNTLLGALGAANPNAGDDSGVLTQAGMNALLAGSQINPSKTKEEIFSAYASDVINVLPSLSAMVSLRVDRFSNKGDINDLSDDYNQTAYSPKFGLVWQPVMDKVSVFANYMDGFSNVAPQRDYDQNVITFDPEHAKQFEGGVKLNLLNNKLAATLSYYDIVVNDMVYSVIDGSNINYYQDGEQKSNGFEAFVTANPITGLNIVAGYSYNDSELTEGDADFKGKKPESAGPQNLANLWASYRFTGGVLNGFGLGFGGNYGSESKIFNRNVAGTFALPEYTVLNASAFYNVDAFTITLKLNNLTDEEYYKGWSTINPQNPRNFAANITYKF